MERIIKSSLRAFVRRRGNPKLIKFYFIDKLIASDFVLAMTKKSKTCNDESEKFAMTKNEGCNNRLRKACNDK